MLYGMMRISLYNNTLYSTTKHAPLYHEIHSTLLYYKSRSALLYRETQVVLLYYERLQQNYPVNISTRVARRCVELANYMHI